MEMENSFRLEVENSAKMRLKKFGGLIWWSLTRYKFLLPTFSVTQVLLALAIVFGLALLMPNLTSQDTIYLSSGAITIGIIAVGCVLAAQIVGSAKQEGIVAYQKTLPVARTSIILADVMIWSLASLPGVIMACVAAVMRFHISLHIDIVSVLMIVLVQMTMIVIGFSLAYWLSPNVMALATQVIMIGGLLFSPITYPAERLPAWLASFYEFLPFVPSGNLIRATLFDFGNFSLLNLIVVIVWGLAALVLSILALSKRG